MENFDKDYEDGNNIEKLVLNLILKKYPKDYIKEGYFKGWDIHIPEIDKTVEVKFDRVAETGKNILIEIESNNEPSGMSTTKADFWVIYDNIKFYWFKTEQIRKCIYENKLAASSSHEHSLSFFYQRLPYFRIYIIRSVTVRVLLFCQTIVS